MTPTRQPNATRVCILTETYAPVIGGGEKQAQALADELVARGHRVLVIARRSHAALPPVERMDGVDVRRIAPVRGGRFSRWLMLPFAWLALVRFRGRYDVVLVAGFKALGLAGVTAASLLDKPCVLKADSNGEMSGAFFAGGLKGLGVSPRALPVRCFVAARNAILRRADAFVAITDGIEREVRAAGVTSHRVRRISNGVDTRRFHPVDVHGRRQRRRELALPATATVITYTGRLVTYKGLPLLLDVARRLQDIRAGVVLLLVGSGGLDLHNCEPALRDCTARQGLGDTVRFTGDVHNVEAFLQASDVFVLPTHDDAFPLALVEAMACGLPCVTTPVGGIPDIVQDGFNGLLVEPGDGDGLRAALERLMDDGPLAATVGAAAAATVRELFGMSAVADRYERLFDDVVASVTRRGQIEAVRT